MLEVGIPLDEMNKTIRLTPSLGMAEIFKQTGVITLELENLSNDLIVFPPDFGIKIYVKEQTKWDTTENLFQYGDKNIMLLPEKEYPSQIPVDLMPLIPSSQTETILRVTVLGNIAGMEKTVGAYLEISLPQ